MHQDICRCGKMQAVVISLKRREQRKIAAYAVYRDQKQNKNELKKKRKDMTKGGSVGTIVEALLSLWLWKKVSQMEVS